MQLEDTYYQSPRWSYEILDCSMPLTFDTYSNCAHQCLYCFSFFQRAIGVSSNDYLHHKVKAVNVEKVKRLFLLECDDHQFNWYIKARHTLQWGGLSDGFDWYEKRFRVSLELLRFFNDINYPISVSTKGTWYLDDPEYVEQLTDRDNIHWKISIIVADEARAAVLEPGTPTPKERAAALARIKQLGVAQVTLRLRPFIIGASDRDLEAIFQMGADAGVDSFSTEFLCLENRVTPNHLARYALISEACGFDVLKYYKKHSSMSGYLRLNYDIKRRHMDRMVELSEKHHIPLYVSDAHHKEKSEACCCCGIRPDGSTVANYYRGHYAEALKIAQARGRVSWSDISALARPLENIPYAGAIGFNTGNSRNRARRAYSSMFDYMHGIWNNSKSYQSPARYFGGALVPEEIDQNGDIVYLYNRPFVDDGYRAKSVSELQALSASDDEISREP